MEGWRVERVEGVGGLGNGVGGLGRGGRDSIWMAIATPGSAEASPSLWAEAHIKITRMTLTIKLDRNWNSFQLANSAPPLSVTDSAIAPSARMKCGVMFSLLIN